MTKLLNIATIARARRLAGATTLSVMLAACADNTAVRGLAVEAGDVSVGLAKSMGELKKDSVDRSRRRAAITARLIAVTRANELNFKQLKEEIGAYGGPDEKKTLGTLNKLMEIAKKGMPEHLVVEQVAITESTRLIGTLGTLNDQGAALRQLGQGLYALGKEKSARDQIKFLFAFAKDLKKDIDAKREALEAAAEKEE